MLSRLVGKKPSRDQSGRMITIHLNARLQPLDRGTFFEDPLDQWLKEQELGKVTGGGTAFNPDSGAIESCDVEMLLADASEHVLQMITRGVEALRAPKGSHLALEGSARGASDRPFRRLGRLSERHRSIA